MRLRANRETEREAVNLARTFFESNSCVFQEVEGANDYGKDAYVDLTENRRVTGLCVALQIKGGRSYRDASGNYRIPLDDEHARIWAESTVPIFGIVHDPDDGGLRWCNISAFLQEVKGVHPTAILIASTNLLTTKTLWVEFKASLEASRLSLRVHPLLQAQSLDEDVSNSAIYDCFALGRSDARVLITLRYLIRSLAPEARRLAVKALSHVTPHPDIWWHSGNWIPKEVKDIVLDHLRWSREEIGSLLEVVPLETFERGGIGEDLFMLFDEDPNIIVSMRSTFEVALQTQNDEVASTALCLLLFWSGVGATDVLAELVNKFPEAKTLSVMPQIEPHIREWGHLTLF